MTSQNNDKQYYLKAADKFGWGPKTARINKQRAQLIQSYLLGKRILEIGCGSGLWVDYFSRLGYDVTGVDFVKEFIDQAKKRFKGNFMVADAQKLPFGNDSFDTVLMISSLEHLDDEAQAIQEAKRAGRRFIIIVPQETPKVLLRRGLIFKHHLDKTHRRVYSRESVKRLLAENGFRIRAIVDTERLPAISVFPELFVAPSFLKRIITRLFFWIFKEKNYYLELMVVADRK